MNALADVTVMKTAAETALANAYTEARAHLPGGDAIAAQRAAAFDIFAKQGLPHRRVEDWKYTDLRALMRDAKPLANPPDAAAKARARTAGSLLGDVECRRIVFVDGAFVPELSDTAALEAGLTVGSLAAALADGDPTLAEKLGKLAPASDVAVALNTHRRRLDHRTAAASDLCCLGKARRELRALARRRRARRPGHADREPRRSGRQ
jgi:Fe-S cluster assembly protein SufD